MASLLLNWDDLEGGVKKMHKPKKHLGSEFTDRTSQEIRSKETNKKVRKERKDKNNSTHEEVENNE